MQKHSKTRNVPFPRPCGATGNDAQKLHAPTFAHFRGAVLMHEVLCLRLVPCFAYVGAEDNRKGIPFVKIVSLLCKLIQFLMVALSVTVHKALILLVFLNHPYQSLAFSRVFGFFI